MVRCSARTTDGYGSASYKMAPWKHLYLLPLSVFIGFIITFFTAYAIAVYLGHVKPDFPYISDGGTCPPESCIFGQLLNITAVLLGLTVYVRYSLVEDYYSVGRQRARWERWLNKTGFFCGLCGALGISIVGNFQETNVLSMHLLGAMMAFFVGVFYLWIQVPITYKTRADMTHPLVFWLRLAISLVCTGLFVSGWSCASATPTELYDRLMDSVKACNASEIPDSEWGLPPDGWDNYVCSTASEWILALLFSFFVLTFVYEFRLVSVERPKLLRVASVRRRRRWVAVETLQPPPPLLARGAAAAAAAPAPGSPPPRQTELVASFSDCEAAPCVALPGAVTVVS